MVVSTPLRPQDNGRRLISAAVGKSLLQAFYDAFCELVRKFLHKAIEQASAIEHAGLARQRDQLDFDVDSVVGFLEAPVEVQAPEITNRFRIAKVRQRTFVISRMPAQMGESGSRARARSISAAASAMTARMN